jgi:tRNA/tmRNA/rRNA uracil-C5-methylase (TrmA/RlmC/RlmD family)
MLAVGMPVTSLQRLLGHEHLDTTMIYAEVADPLLRQDYYRGIRAIDTSSKDMPIQDSGYFHQKTLQQLILDLKEVESQPIRREEILNQMQRLLEGAHESTDG